MTKYESSAIIGYHRSGASNYEISQIMNVPIETIHNVIKEYFKKKAK